MAVRIEDLDYLDEEFIDAEEPEGFSRIPDGKYIMRVYAARPDVEEDETRTPRLEWELIIEKGPLATRHAFRRNVLRDKRAVGWLKKDLRTCGVDIDAPEFRLSDFMINRTEELLDILLEVTVVNKAYTNSQGVEKMGTNIYFDGLAQIDEPEETVVSEPATRPTRPAAAATSGPRGGGRPERKTNPFKDE